MINRSRNTIFRKLLSFLGLAGLCVILGAGCQSARMAMPSELESQATTFQCRGRGGFTLAERFEFGPYSVTDVRRSWTTRTSWGIAEFEQSRARQQYEYRMAGPRGVQWLGQAATGVKRNDIRAAAWGGELMVGLSFDLNFVVRLSRDKQADTLTLILAQRTGSDVMKGSLTDGKTVYSIEGTRRLAGTSIALMEASGYVILKSGLPVAAVEVLNEGSVRFADSLNESERDILAAASAGILLYMDISGK